MLAAVINFILSSSLETDVNINAQIVSLRKLGNRLMSKNRVDGRFKFACHLGQGNRILLMSVESCYNSWLLYCVVLNFWCMSIVA